MKKGKGVVFTLLIAALVILGVYLIINNGHFGQQAAVRNGANNVIDAGVSGTVGEYFTYQVKGQNNTKSFEATGLPDGLTIDKNSGLISGTPTVAGNYVVTITLVSNAGNRNSTTYNFTVNPPAVQVPVITSETTASGTVGTAFSYQISATNSPTSFDATGLPSGLSVDTSTGLISGTPITAGTSTVTLYATNGGGNGSATLSLTIAGQPPVITSSSSATGKTGVAFSYQITASNNPTSYNATNLPGGLSVSTSTGLISGTPTTAGTYVISISATNASGTDTANLTLTVTTPVQMPVITSETTASGTVGTAFSYQISATNSPTSFDATGLPAGLSVNTTTGAITGTPTIAAATNVTISATNDGGTATATLTITVTASTQIPVISSSLTATGMVGAPFTYQITATNSPTSFDVTGLPLGLSINKTTGVISGVPSVVATTTATIKAINGSGAGSANLVITVVSSGSNFNAASMGAWGIGGAVKSQFDQYKLGGKFVIKGYNVTADWSELETAKDKFDWSALDTGLDMVMNTQGLYAGFQIMAGPAAPSYIYCAEDSNGNAIDTATCVPKVHATNVGAGQAADYPYYLDSYYKDRWYNFLTKVADHIQSKYPNAPKLVYWQMAEGSTGDEGPYKGTIPTKYQISDTDWTNFKEAAWSYIDTYNSSKNPKLEILINSGNDGQYFDWLGANIPCYWTKAGNVSHEYSYAGEINDVNRYSAYDQNTASCNRIRAEFQNVYDTSSWKKAPLANTYAITLSALTIGLDMFNLPGEAVSSSHNTSDLTVYDTFNKYAGLRKASDSDKAFVYLRDVIDLADTARFPEATYGALWTDADKYNKAVQNVMDNNLIPPAEKGEQITEKKITYFNTNRALKIEGADQFLKNSAVKNKPNWISFDAISIYGQNSAYAVYDQDFGIDMIPDNYGLFIKQLDPNGTSIGQWRIGTTNSRYGRYARSFDRANGKTEMTFDVDDTLHNSVRIANTQISITYYDSGYNEWSLNYYTGLSTPGSVTIKNNNSNTWKTYTTTISNMALSNKQNGGDFSLKYVSGDNTIFSMIELQLI